ncbi:MAG: hypothetical protein KAG56_11485 [Sulfurovaceae bacterium]|nr:hypothetical protein [Sulfurovaceae bacterium]
MLTEINKEPSFLKTISFRIDNELVDAFRMLCKEHKVKQSTVIKNALKQAIAEMENKADAK